MRYWTSSIATIGLCAGSGTVTSKMLRPIARRTPSSFDCTIGGSWRGSPTMIARRSHRDAA